MIFSNAGLNRYIRILFAAILIQGCATTYYGLSEEEWSELTDEERIAKKTEFERVIESKQAQAHKAMIDARTQSIIDPGTRGPKY